MADELVNRAVPDFRRRSSREELMDDPATPDDELREALAQLTVINRRLGGYRPSIEGIAALVPRGQRSLDVLDVGGGSVDVGRAVIDWARRRRLELRWTSIDLTEASVAHARELSSAYPEITCRREDLFELSADSRFDIVHGSLVLHHFAGAAASRALETMWRLARWGVVINDLHRHPLAYHSIRWLTRTLSRNRLIRNDAPLSVLRAFRREDWSELATTAGCPSPEVEWRWAFRWQCVFRRSGGPATLVDGEQAR